jgi:phage terminase Nu1 subunit (DNA packaging protein)
MSFKLENVFGETQTAALLSVPSPSEPRLLNKRELAAFLKISLRALENWQSSKKIPVLKLAPRTVRFDLCRVLAALAKYEIRETGASRA